MECISPQKKTKQNKTKQVDSFKVASHPRRDNVGKEIYYSRKIDLTPIFFLKKNIFERILFLPEVLDKIVFCSLIAINEWNVDKSL